MSQEIVKFHHQPSGEGIPGTDRAPDPETEAVAGLTALRHSGIEVMIDDSLQKTPNLNKKYANQIDLIKRQFASDGLDIAPITVLSRHDFEEVDALSRGRSEEASVGGSYDGRHVLVVEKSEAVGMFGDDYVLGVGLHESAHSTQGRKKLVITSKTAGSKGGAEDGDRPARAVQATKVGGLQKYKWEDTGNGPEIRPVGNFLEEAYADLKRVRSLREMGRSVGVADGRTLVETDDSTKIVYASENRRKALNTDQEYVELPMEFAMGMARVDEGLATEASTSGVAAYGVELLDQHIPGFFEDMEASRQDPAAQRHLIQKLNKLRPGLYKELRDLSYTTHDFREGLVKIAEAIDADSGGVQSDWIKPPLTT